MTEKIEKLPVTDILTLRKLLVHGVETEIEYEIPFYKEVYEKSFTIKLRPLSNSEFNDLFLDVCLKIQDPILQDVLYYRKSKEELEKLEGKYSKLEYAKALKEYENLLIYTSMKDFVEGLTMKDIEKLEGKTDIYNKIGEISGRTDEIQKKISRFRELNSKSKSNTTSE
jgi:hypothetical protein